MTEQELKAINDRVITLIESTFSYGDSGEAVEVIEQDVPFLIEEVRRLREALKYYAEGWHFVSWRSEGSADGKVWSEHRERLNDHGEKARAALGGK